MAEGLEFAVASLTLGISFFYRGTRQAEDVRLIYLFQGGGFAASESVLVHDFFHYREARTAKMSGLKLF